MNFKIIGRNVEVTEALKEKVTEKIGKLEKFLNTETNVSVTLTVEKLRQIVEVTIPVKGTILRSEVSEKDMYVAIDESVDVLEKQLLKYKDKLKHKHNNDNVFKQEYLMGNYNTNEQEGLENTHKVFKTKRFDIKAMNIDEAIMQMELLGHEFFVFLEEDGKTVNVLYKRKNGTYGIIQPQY